MPPKVKFQREEIVGAAAAIVREQGYDALTAREVAAKLGVSTRPIFTYFDTMEQLRAEVCSYAKRRYLEYIERGLTAPIPNLGVGQQYIRFAREEPELFRLLFLTKPDNASDGATEALGLAPLLGIELAQPFADVISALIAIPIGTGELRKMALQEEALTQ